MLLNSTVKQTVDVYLDDDNTPCYVLTALGKNNDNRGTVVRTSGTTGRVQVKVSVDGRECETIEQAITVAQSQGSSIGIVAAYNGTQGDSLYDDVYVILTWRQPQST